MSIDPDVDADADPDAVADIDLQQYDDSIVWSAGSRSGVVVPTDDGPVAVVAPGGVGEDVFADALTTAFTKLRCSSRLLGGPDHTPTPSPLADADADHKYDPRASGGDGDENGGGRA